MELYQDTTEYNNDLDQTWKSNDVQKEMKMWMRIVNNILRKTIGIIRISNKNKQEIDNEVRELLQVKMKIRKKSNSTNDIETKKKLIKRKEIETLMKQKIAKKMKNRKLWKWPTCWVVRKTTIKNYGKLKDDHKPNRHVPFQ